MVSKHGRVCVRRQYLGECKGGYDNDNADVNSGSDGDGDDEADGIVNGNGCAGDGDTRLFGRAIICSV